MRPAFLAGSELSGANNSPAGIVVQILTFSTLSDIHDKWANKDKCEKGVWLCKIERIDCEPYPSTLNNAS